MKLAYDAEIFFRQRSGGISVHFTSLISALLSKGHYIELLCPRSSYSLLLQNVNLCPLLEHSKVSVVLYSNSFHFYRLCADASFDVLHCTYYAWRPCPASIPLIRSFHDAALLRYPCSVSPIRAFARFLLQLVSYISCDGLVCVSNFSMEEYLATYSLVRSFLFRKPLPLCVVLNATSLEGDVPLSSLCPSALQARSILCEREPFRVLYIGLRGGYKNFGNGLHALCLCLKLLRLAGNDPKVVLTVVSREPLAKSEILDLTQSGVEYVFCESVSAAELANLYASSSLLLHTSVYEGFGITVLEAMRIGCPVLAVDIPSSREVASETIFYSPSGSVASLSASLYPLIVDRSLLTSKVLAAKTRAKLFSWGESADALERFYLELIFTKSVVSRSLRLS